jgi:flagellar hook capping protein FlgD
MGRDIRVWLALGILALVGTGTSARAQVSPANMQSGCVNFAAATGTLETSLYAVPAGYTFVLTDFNFTPSGYPTPPVTATWAVSMWIRDWNLDNTVRWVTGGLWDANGNHNWPVHANWTTGIVFPSNEILRFGIGGAAYPASTICWSGYLVPNSTSSVNPTPGAPSLGMRAAPNPATKDVELSFVLAKRQPVVLAVFSVEGRRIRTLQRGPLEAGHHQLAWDGRDDHGKPVADGMYFARLEAAEGSRTTSIVHVR